MDALLAAVRADTAVRETRGAARAAALGHLRCRLHGAAVPAGPPANGHEPRLRSSPHLVIAGLIDHVQGATAELLAARLLDPALRMRLAALPAVTGSQ